MKMPLDSIVLTFTFAEVFDRCMIPLDAELDLVLIDRKILNNTGGDLFHGASGL